MPQCLFVGSTRVCSGSPYRVNGRSSGRKFPRLSAAMRKNRRPAHRVIDALNIPKEQKKMVKDLIDAVLAVDWNAANSANASDIHRSVQLLLVNAAGDMKGHYTLVAYPKP